MSDALWFLWWSFGTGFMAGLTTAAARANSPGAFALALLIAAYAGLLMYESGRVLWDEPTVTTIYWPDGYPMRPGDEELLAAYEREQGRG